MKKVLAFVMVLAMVFGCIAYAEPLDKVQTGEFSKNATPPNELGIAKMLMKNGAIDSNATAEAIEEAVQKYIEQKLAPDKNKKDDKKLLLEYLSEDTSGDINISNMLHGRKLGKGYPEVGGIVEGEKDDQPYEAKMLILLAEFGDDTEMGDGYVGPFHNEIPRPQSQAAADSDLWVDDFSREHYQNMLFTEGGYDAKDYKSEDMHLDSMIDYYLEMSNGSYKVNGDVYGWYKLPHSEAYYGDDEGTGNDNKLPGTPADLVSDLLDVVYESGDIEHLEDYDVEDTMDLDGDGDLREPDGIIDHLVIVHAGIDQSGGGGAQGDNAIWAHSSSVYDAIPANVSDGRRVWTDDEGDDGILAYNYIIQGENGSIGVFCHEYGHDLGLPDEYDTIYSGNGDPVGFYSIMSSGSWAGKPLGTKPTPISPWGRWQLGQLWGGIWVQPTLVNYDDIGKSGMTYKLDETTNLGSNEQTVLVNLPKKLKITTSPYEGGYSFFGGKADEIDNTIRTEAISLPTGTSSTLDFMTWYDIEENWDFGFVQISEDGGNTWTSLSSDRTTDNLDPSGYPAISDNLPGYTGNSGGWVNEVIDLSDYAGKDIMLQFRYMTDWGTNLEGMYVDNIKVYTDTSILFEDGAENDFAQLENNGWSTSQGYEEKSHYYMLEWRNYHNTDESLQYGYNWNGDIPEFYVHNTGMLVWYRDTSYTDNWVGEHPGHGFLGIVDSHPQPLVAKGNTLRTRIQIHDAAFGLERGDDKYLTFYGKYTNVQSKQAQPEFNDSKSYWNNKAPSSGIIIPSYGLKFRVLGASRDNSVGEISIYK